MGNAGSNAAVPRERHKSSDAMQPHTGGTTAGAGGAGTAAGGGASPLRDHPFNFDKKPILGFAADAHEVEEEPYYTKQLGQGGQQPTAAGGQQQLAGHHGNAPTDAQRADAEASAADAAAELQAQLDAEQPPALPTVFKWDGGGKQVFLSGTFTDWKSLPMVRSHGDFVTIIDLPEGDHQYKFCVDGEWRHDPKLVSVRCVCVCGVV